MGKSASESIANFERGVQGKGAAKYQASVQTAPGNWAAGLSESGLAPGPISQRAYAEGLAAGAPKWASHTAGKGQKWYDRTRQGLSR